MIYTTTTHANSILAPNNSPTFDNWHILFGVTWAEFEELAKRGHRPLEVNEQHPETHADLWDLTFVDGEAWNKAVNCLVHEIRKEGVES